MRAKALVALLVLVACGDPTGPSVKTVSIGTASFNTSVGGTKQLSAVIFDTDDNVASVTPEWSTANAAIATVTQSGMVTGVSEGTVDITVSAGGKSSTAVAHVRSMPSAGWQGTAVNSAFVMSLVESGGTVTGTGSVIFGSSSPALSTVTGTYAAPNITLQVVVTGFDPMTITGTVAGTKITGTITGNGFSGEAILLTKQPNS